MDMYEPMHSMHVYEPMDMSMVPSRVPNSDDTKVDGNFTFAGHLTVSLPICWICELSPKQLQGFELSPPYKNIWKSVHLVKIKFVCMIC